MNHLTRSVLFLAIVSLPFPRAAGRDKDVGATELVSLYYPLTIGTQWVYQVGPVQVTMKVAKHEKVGDVMCGLIESSVDGKVVASEHIAAGANGVFRHTFNGQKASEPLCILKLPAKKDQTWKFDVKIATETVKGAFVSGEEEIKVAAGTYQAVTAFTTECDLNGNKAEFKYWFAPHVGVVRQTISFGGREIVSELKEFKAGK